MTGWKGWLKAQLTPPPNFFCLNKSPCFSDHHCKKFIILPTWFFKVPKIGRFGAPWPSNSPEWGELACDVIEGLTKFRLWGECMWTCNSANQNHHRMQGRCVVGGSSSAASSGERYPLSSIPLHRWHSSRNEKKMKEVCWLVWSRTETGSHRAVLRSWVRH